MDSGSIEVSCEGKVYQSPAGIQRDEGYAFAFLCISTVLQVLSAA
jgi:hypothetical protein